jgi:hypothetical protein
MTTKEGKATIARGSGNRVRKVTLPGGQMVTFEIVLK